MKNLEAVSATAVLSLCFCVQQLMARADSDGGQNQWCVHAPQQRWAAGIFTHRCEGWEFRQGVGLSAGIHGTEGAGSCCSYGGDGRNWKAGITVYA